MKNLKYFILSAFTGLFFASCNEAAQGPSQAEIDQQVEAKVKEATDKLKADCDAQIMNAAQLKKDSILLKLGNKPAAVPSKPTTAPSKPATAPTKPTAKEPTKQAPVQTPPVKEEPKGLKSLSDQSKQEAGKQGGLKSLSDQNKAQEANKQGGGGLKSLRDNK